MRRSVSFFVLLLFLTVCFTAAAEAAAPFRVTLLLGGLTDDKGFNQLCLEGLENAKNRYRGRIAVRSLEAKDAAELGNTLFDEVAPKSDLVIVADHRYLEGLRKAVVKYPDVKFAVIDGSDGIPEVKDVVFREEEGGFMAGVLAGLLTTRAEFDRINEDAAVGVMIGMEIPATQRFAYGFKVGVNHVDPNIEIFEATVGNFLDIEKGREVALSMRNRGVDIIFAAAGRAGLGAIDSAVTGGFWVIGADAEQETIDPDAVLTSVIKNSGVAVYRVVEDCMHDNWNLRTLSLGVREDAIALSIWTRQAKAKIPVDIRDTLDGIEEEISSGRLEIKIK